MTEYNNLSRDLDVLRVNCELETLSRNVESLEHLLADQHSIPSAGWECILRIFKQFLSNFTSRSETWALETLKKNIVDLTRLMPRTICEEIFIDKITTEKDWAIRGNIQVLLNQMLAIAQMGKQNKRIKAQAIDAIIIHLSKLLKKNQEEINYDSAIIANMDHEEIDIIFVSEGVVKCTSDQLRHQIQRIWSAFLREIDNKKIALNDEQLKNLERVAKAICTKESPKHLHKCLSDFRETFDEMKFLHFLNVLIGHLENQLRYERYLAREKKSGLSTISHKGLNHLIKMTWGKLEHELLGFSGIFENDKKLRTTFSYFWYNEARNLGLPLDLKEIHQVVSDKLPTIPMSTRTQKSKIEQTKNFLEVTIQRLALLEKQRDTLQHKRNKRGEV